MPNEISQSAAPEADVSVLVALSGGVDSAVSVRLLQEQDFRVQGAVIRFSKEHDKAVHAAQAAAAELGIPLHVIDGQALFEQEVIEPFCNLYATGRTPSPCLLCNPAVKFRLLCEKADELGIHLIASGHYATCHEKEGRFWLGKAESKQRDQSYMLYRLPQSILQRLCLPLGRFEKPMIRELAADFGLSCAHTPDSQEICFIPNDNYAAFIKARGIAGKQGHFIGPEGQNLGEHRGVLYYTVGQRKGLGISLGKPVFVREIAENGDVHLAYAGGEYASQVWLCKLHNATEEAFAPGQHFDVKIRSAARAVACKITKVEAQRLCFAFEEPQRAVAPGQHAVFYKGESVYGGGEIQQSL